MRSKIVRIVLPFLFVVGVAFPAFAQEETPAPEPTSVEATADPTVVVTPAPTTAPAPGTDPTTAVNLITLITGIAIGVVTAGAGILGTLAFVVSKIRNDRPLLAAIEGLIVSRPPEQIEKLREAGGVLRDTAEIIDEVTDGVPVMSKPVAQ